MQSQQNSSSKKGMIFFLRHGERADCVDFDELSKIEISVDPHLTELGKLQARYSAYELRKMTEDHIKENTKYFIISSPFLRCIQTASEIALALGKKISLGIKFTLKISSLNSLTTYILKVLLCTFSILQQSFKI